MSLWDYYLATQGGRSAKPRGPRMILPKNAWVFQVCRMHL